MSLDHLTENRSTSAGTNVTVRRAALRVDATSAAQTSGVDVSADWDTLRKLAVLAAQHIPGVCGASVILGGADGLDDVGVSAPFVAEVERLQQRDTWSVASTQSESPR